MPGKSSLSILELLFWFKSDIYQLPVTEPHFYTSVVSMLN